MSQPETLPETLLAAQADAQDGAKEPSMSHHTDTVGSDELIMVRPLEPVISGQLASFAIEYAAVESGDLTIELEPEGQFTIAPPKLELVDAGDKLSVRLLIVSTSGQPGECRATFRLRFATRVCVFRVDVP